MLSDKTVNAVTISYKAMAISITKTTADTVTVVMSEGHPANFVKSAAGGLVLNPDIERRALGQLAQTSASSNRVQILKIVTCYAKNAKGVVTGLSTWAQIISKAKVVGGVSGGTLFMVFGYSAQAGGTIVIPAILGPNIIEGLSPESRERVASIAMAMTVPRGKDAGAECNACYEDLKARLWFSDKNANMYFASGNGSVERDTLDKYADFVARGLESCSCKKNGKVAIGGQDAKTFGQFMSTLRGSNQRFDPFRAPAFIEASPFVTKGDICL